MPISFPSRALSGLKMQLLAEHKLDEETNERTGAGLCIHGKCIIPSTEDLVMEQVI